MKRIVQGITLLIAACPASVTGFPTPTTISAYHCRGFAAAKDTGTVTDEKSPDLLFRERLNIIYDSKCSVCQWEVDNLTHLMSTLPGSENEPRLIRFTDLEAEDGYDETDPRNGGITYEDGMRSFRAVRTDGSTIKGIDVFKEAYSIVEYGWLWRWTNAQLLRAVADLGYKLFAGVRTDVTRGSRVEDLIERYYNDSNDNNDECEQCKQKLAE